MTDRMQTLGGRRGDVGDEKERQLWYDLSSPSSVGMTNASCREGGDPPEDAWVVSGRTQSGTTQKSFSEMSERVFGVWSCL
jgi:hypothetical protein